MTTTTVRGSFAARAGRPKMHYAYKKSKTTEKSLPALQDIEAVSVTPHSARVSPKADLRIC